MFRILAANQPVRERRNQLAHPHYARPEGAQSPPRGTWEQSHGRGRARLRAHRRLPRTAAARRRGNLVDEDQIRLSNRVFTMSSGTLA